MSDRQVPCQQIVEWVTDYLEGELEPGRRRAFEEHLAGCDGCARYLEQIRTTRDALGSVSDDDLSPEAWASLRAAFGAEERG